MVGYAALSMAQASPLKARLYRNALILVAASYLLQSGMIYSGLRSWQADTRAIAEALDDQGGTIFVRGDYHAIASHQKAGIQHLRGLYARLHYLTGRPIQLCNAPDKACPDLVARDDGRPISIFHVEGGSVVQLNAATMAKVSN